MSESSETSGGVDDDSEAFVFFERVAVGGDEEEEREETESILSFAGRAGTGGARGEELRGRVDFFGPLSVLEEGGVVFGGGKTNVGPPISPL